MYPCCIHIGYIGVNHIDNFDKPYQIPLSKSAIIAYEQLRKQILDGQISPGMVLQQVALEQELGVSRTPIRHALQQLAYDGLVEFLPGQTARVVATTLQDALELRQIRMWLEVPALLLALRHNPQPDELFAIFDQVDALGDEPTPDACEQLVILDEKFHNWLLRESKNTNLMAITRRMLDRLFRTKSFNIVEDYDPVRSNLLALRDAIKKGDRRQVHQLMIEHMTDTGTPTIRSTGFEEFYPE